MAIELEPKTLITTIEVSKFAVSLQPKQIVVEVGKYERVEGELVRYRPLGRAMVDAIKEEEKFNTWLQHIESGNKEVLFTGILEEYKVTK